MNTKGIKFLAVLAVLAMAFAACAVFAYTENSTAESSAVVKTGSPLGDGAIATGETLTVGNLSLELYLQQTMSAVKSSNTLTVYGYDTTWTAPGTTWKEAYIGWNTANIQTVSFNVMTLNGESDAGKYYIYQSNPVLPESENKKVSELDIAKVADAAGNNPSFEIPVKTNGASTVVLKLIKATTEPTVAQAEAMAEGADCVKYTIEFKPAPTEDTAAVDAGFTVSMKNGGESSAKVYYKHLSAAIANVTPSGTAKEAGTNDYYVKLLADDEDIVGVMTKKDNAHYAEVDIDLGGHTYKNNYATVGSSSLDKIIYVQKTQVWNIYNGTLMSDLYQPDGKNPEVNSSDFRFLQSYGILTLGGTGTTLNIDLSKVVVKKKSTVAPYSTGEFVGLYISGGTTTIKSGVTIDAGTHYAVVDAAHYAYNSLGGLSGTTTVAAKVIIDGAQITGNVGAMIVSSGSTFSGKNFLPGITNGAEVVIKNNSVIVGNLVSGKFMVDGGVLPTIGDSFVKYKFIAEGLTVPEGKKITVKSGTAPFDNAIVEVPLNKSITNNGTIVNEGTITGAGSISGTGVLQNKGKLSVAIPDESEPWWYNSVYCLVEVYGGSEWSDGHTVYAKNIDGAVLKIGSETKTKYVSHTQTVSSSGTTAATYDIYADTNLRIGTWIGGEDYTETVTIHKNATLTLDVETTIGVRAEVNLEAGAALAGSVPLNVKGKLNLADSSQYYTHIATADLERVKVIGSEGSSSGTVEYKELADTTVISKETFGTADVIVTNKAGLTAVTVPESKAVVISGVPAATAVLDISADKSEVTVNTGNNEATYTVTAGGDNKIYLEDVKGSLTFTKGSIEIDVSKWTGGKILLDAGAVVKIFGTTTSGSDLEISMKKANTTATVTVEKEKTLDITFSENTKKFIIGEGITFAVDGKMTVTSNNASVAFETNDKAVINGTLTLTSTPNAAKYNAKKALDIYGTVKGAVDADDNVVAYNASNINAAAFEEFPEGKSLSGKDKNGGTWTYSVVTGGAELTLTNFTGNYNFQTKINGTTIAAGITDIVLSGDSKITYTVPKDTTLNYAVFGNVTTEEFDIKTVQGSGSLEVIVNVSAIENLETSTAEDKFSVFAGAAVELNGVDVKVTVSGTNAKWDEKNTDGIKAYGVTAGTSFDMIGAGLYVDVLSAYEIETVYGVYAYNEAVKPIKVISTSELEVVSAGTGVYGGNLTVQNSAVDIDGKVLGADVKAISITNASTVVVSNGLKASGDSSVTQNSTLDITDFNYNGGKLTNNGIITLNGNTVIKGEVDNKATIVNEGVMGVYGKFTNSNGTFTNKGTFKVLDKTFKDYDDVSPFTDALVITGDSAPSADTYVKVAGIKITAIESNADGSADVKAELSFAPVIELKTVNKVFKGTLTPTQTDGSYTLYLSNGTATVTVVYDATKTAATDSDTIGSRYTVSVAGQVETDDAVYFLEANKTKAGDVPGATVGDKIKLSADADVIITTAADFDLTDGMFVNEGIAVISHSSDAEIIAGGGFVGDLTTEITTVTISGGFAGDLTANGTGKVTVGNFIGDIAAKGEVEVTALKIMIGDITTKGAVTISGKLEGNVATEANVTVAGTLDGDVQVTLKATKSGTLTVSGKMDGDLKYISSYKEKYADTTDTTYTSVLHVEGDMAQEDESVKAFTIAMSTGTNATISADGKPGCLGFGTTLDAADTGKSVELKLTEGKLLVSTLVNLPARFALVVESGATIEVAKTGGSFNVASAALKVNKDAIKNFETGSAAPVNYGKVTYIMSFDIDDGAYTIYSDVAYALSNCNEGAQLTVGSNANISANVALKKGVNVIISTGVTLDFKEFGLEMEEGAKITLEGTGKIKFAETGAKTSGTENIYYTVSGKVAYEDNVIVMDGVRFTAASNTFEGVAATSSANAKLKVALAYDQGKATVEDGYATGTIALSNDKLTWKAEGTTPTLVSGTFEIAEDAVFDAVSITDEFGKVTYKAGTGDIPFVVDEIKMYNTFVYVYGTLNLSDSTTVNGAYLGSGKVTLAAGKSFTLAAADQKKVGDEKKYAPSVSVTIVDTTDDENGYALLLVSPYTGVYNTDPAKETTSQTVVFKATTYKESTNKVMTITGKVEIGAIAATNDAYLSKLIIDDKAGVVADAVYIIGEKADKSVAKGSLGAKELYMYTDSTKQYAELDFQIYFENEGYYVYTYFENVDFELISDITISGNKDNYDLVGADGLMPAGTTKVDLSGNDVSITVAEGKTLTINVPLIIGTPIDDLGDEGSALVGKFIITKLDDVGGPRSYIIAYSDVDTSEAEILQSDKKTAAVYSMLDIDDIPYATIFANEDNVVLADVDKKIVPEIEGYTFAMWVNYNLGAKWVGETNAYADFKAVLITITVKYVAGVDYYMDGLLFQVFDTPTDVKYGSYFTAKISDTSKYQGNPMINGVKTYTVEGPDTLIATGVEPIPEPPQPEPVIGDSGMSLTDILLIVLVVLIAIMVVILVLRLNRS